MTDIGIYATEPPLDDEWSPLQTMTEEAYFEEEWRAYVENGTRVDFNIIARAIREEATENRIELTGPGKTLEQLIEEARA